MKIKIKFLQSGESPDFGKFEIGDEREMDKDTADLLKERGVVSDVAVKSAIRKSSPSASNTTSSAIDKED